MTYSYECASCGETLSAEQRITDAPLEDCPRCERPALRRLITRASDFILRGDGWAKDGYK